MSSRGLIKSMLIIGSAQFVNILISVFRMKIVALLLGPSGVGLLSIYNSLLATVSTVSGLGMGASGVRQLASSKADEMTLSRVRVTLFASLLAQGLLAMVVVWLLRDFLAQLLFGNAMRATEVGLVGIAVVFSLLASSQTALLQGMRRIGDLGRVTVLGALAGTIAGIYAVWLRGEYGLIWFLIVQPLTAVMVALYFTRKLPRTLKLSLNIAEIWRVWRPMVALGSVFMLGGLATAATDLFVRGVITSELGLEAAGFFAASWGITMLYVGFLLNAMGADYYPRLAEIINDKPAVNRLMNDQMQLGLAIGGPVLLLLVGLAPWVISLLYTSEFQQAVGILQWQTVGNVFKLASWPLGYAFVAGAQSRVFLSTQLFWNAIFVSMIWFGLPWLGLEVAGIGFLAAYVLYFGLLNILARRLHSFRWEKLSVWLFGAHVGLMVALLGLARVAPVAGAIFSVVLAVATGLVGLRIVLVKVGPGGKIADNFARVFSLIRWPLGGR